MLTFSVGGEKWALVSIVEGPEVECNGLQNHFFVKRKEVESTLRKTVLAVG